MNNNRLLALGLAVLHHGLSCLAEKSIPARANTVMLTADEFLDYLDDVPTSERHRGRRS